MPKSDKSVHTTHPDAQWFPKAGLGFYIHWGIASVHGNADLSWAMIANTTWDSMAHGSNKITPNEYWKLADRFKPDKYDPDKWIKAAAEAGFKYAVMTTMHHDGFTMWPSEVGDFGVQSYLPGVDLIGQYIDACRKYGLKVGLYYSPPEWHFEREYMSFNLNSFGDNMNGYSAEKAGVPFLDQDLKVASPKTPPADFEQQKRTRFHARVKELMTRYGKIDLLWFDGGVYDNEVRDMARQLQPHLVINSRSCDGDFDCTECELPEDQIDGWFETCHCWQACDIKRPNGKMLDVWGYLDTEQYKSAEWMVETYEYLKKRGANFLLNVSPRPTGELPDVVYQRLEEVKRLLKA